MWAICTVTAAVALLGLFWPAISSGFRILLGDLGDWRFIAAILEHWVTFARAHWAWNSPPMFFPVKGVLASGDALFLFVPFYALGRAFQMSPYHAMEFTMAALMVVGFSGATWLLRRSFGLPAWIAILGGALYGFAGIRISHLSHVQLYAALFLPLLLSMGIALTARLRRGERGLQPALLLVVGTALLLFTSFYVGWFSILLVSIALLCRAAIGRLDSEALPLRSEAGPHGLSTALVAAFAFIFALLPFLLLYLPAYMDSGPRPWDFTFQLLPTVSDLVNVGTNNLVWGSFMSALAPPDRFHGYEMSYGVPFALLGLFLGTSVVILMFPRTKWLGGINFDPSAIWLRVFALSVIAAWALLIRTDKYTAWWAVFHLVPGGSAIRAPYRFQVVLFLPLVIVAMFGLRGLWRAAKTRAIGLALIGTLCVLLIAEQVQKSPAVFDAKEETDWLKQLQAPPSDCRSFLILHDPNRVRSWYAANVDALLIAIRTRLPTINGYSGNFPPHWGGLQDPEGESYLPTASEWVRRNQLEEGLCTLKPSTGVWRRVLPVAPEKLLGVNLVGPAITPLETGVAFTRGGFYELEPMGRWTNGLGTVEFRAPVAARRLHIEGIHSNPLAGDVRVIVNGQVLKAIEPPGTQFVLDVPLDEPVRQLQIDSATFVPALAGINRDQRQLGTMIRRLTLEP